LLYICLMLITLAVLVVPIITLFGSIIGAAEVESGGTLGVLVVVAILSGFTLLILMIMFSIYAMVTYQLTYFRITGQPTLLEQNTAPLPPPEEVRSMGYVG